MIADALCKAAGGLTSRRPTCSPPSSPARACASSSAGELRPGAADLETEIALPSPIAARVLGRGRRQRPVLPARSGSASSCLIERLRALPAQKAASCFSRAPTAPRTCRRWRWKTATSLFVPAARPPTVGVFGSVFNAGSYLYRDGQAAGRLPAPGRRPHQGRRRRQRLCRARQRQRGQRRQSTGGWWSRKSGEFEQTCRRCPVTPCSCPKKLDKTTFVQARQGLDADPLPVRHRAGGHQERGELTARATRWPPPPQTAPRPPTTGWTTGRPCRTRWPALRERLWLLVLAPLAAGCVALAITFAIAPTFTASMTSCRHSRRKAARPRPWPHSARWPAWPGAQRCAQRGRPVRGADAERHRVLTASSTASS